MVFFLFLFARARSFFSAVDLRRHSHTQCSIGSPNSIQMWKHSWIFIMQFVCLFRFGSFIYLAVSYFLLYVSLCFFLLILIAIVFLFIFCMILWLGAWFILCTIWCVFCCCCCVLMTCWMCGTMTIKQSAMLIMHRVASAFVNKVFHSFPWTIFFPTQSISMQCMRCPNKTHLWIQMHYHLLQTNKWSSFYVSNTSIIHWNMNEARNFGLQLVSLCEKR